MKTKTTTKPWEQPGLTSAFRAEALMQPWLGEDCIYEIGEAAERAIAAAEQQARNAALETAAGVADGRVAFITVYGSDDDRPAGEEAASIATSIRALITTGGAGEGGGE